MFEWGFTCYLITQLGIIFDVTFLLYLAAIPNIVSIGIISCKIKKKNFPSIQKDRIKIILTVLIIVWYWIYLCFKLCNL